LLGGDGGVLGMPILPGGRGGEDADASQAMGEA